MDQQNLDLLLDEDREFLQESGGQFEVHEENVGGSNEVHVILKDFKLPDEYLPSTVDLLFRLPPGYNTAIIDLFWASPWVKLRSGSDPEACSGTGNFCGKTWQQWSRHYQGWRPNVDNLRSFVAAVNKELQRRK